MTDPATERTLPRMVAAAVARYGARPAIADGDVRFSFAELGAAGWRTARAFLAAGIAPGDRVAIWAPNVAEWVLAAIGAQSVGAVVVPISTRNKGRDRHVLRKSGARLLLTIAGFLDTDYVGMLRPGGHPCPRSSGSCRCCRRATPVRSAGPTSSPRGGRARVGGARADACGRRCRRHAVHLGHHGQAEGRAPASTARTCARSRSGRAGSGSARGIATSWSRRSSTRSATRPAGSPR